MPSSTPASSQAATRRSNKNSPSATGPSSLPKRETRTRPAARTLNSVAMVSVKSRKSG